MSGLLAEFLTVMVGWRPVRRSGVCCARLVAESSEIKLRALLDLMMGDEGLSFWGCGEDDRPPVGRGTAIT